MKIRYIIPAAMLAAGTQAETVNLPSPVVVGGQISQINVGDVRYDPNDNSWSISAEPVVIYPQIESTNGVNVLVSLDVRLNISVSRAEIEAATGKNVDDVTVKQLNDTVRAIALGKAVSVMSEGAK